MVDRRFSNQVVHWCGLGAGQGENSTGMRKNTLKGREGNGGVKIAADILLEEVADLLLEECSKCPHDIEGFRLFMCMVRLACHGYTHILARFLNYH